jgi:hypothetical protein
MNAKETKDWWVQCTPALLTIAGIDHEVFNNGQHIRIDHNGLRYEAWPSTGMWVILIDPKKPATKANIQWQNIGMRRLINKLTKEKTDGLPQ